MDNKDIKIVADSSADTFEMEGVEYACAPLKIRTDVKEYVDDGKLDVAGMVNDLAAYKGKMSLLQAIAFTVGITNEVPS